MTRTSKQLKEQEEKYVIDCFVNYLNLEGLHWTIKEYPIQSISQKQLGKGCNVPDAIIHNAQDNGKEWLEVTKVSSSQDEQKKIGQERKSLLDESGKIQPITIIDVMTYDLKRGISEAIIKKNNKDYTKFAGLADLSSKGILIIWIDLRAPFYDAQMHLEICSNFTDKPVLSSLHCGASNFKEIYLFVCVYDAGKWVNKFELIADSNTMKHLSD